MRLVKTATLAACLLGANGPSASFAGQHAATSPLYLPGPLATVAAEPSLMAPVPVAGPHHAVVPGSGVVGSSYVPLTRPATPPSSPVGPPRASYSQLPAAATPPAGHTYQPTGLPYHVAPAPVHQPNYYPLPAAQPAPVAVPAAPSASIPQPTGNYHQPPTYSYPHAADVAPAPAPTATTWMAPPAPPIANPVTALPVPSLPPTPAYAPTPTGNAAGLPLSGPPAAGHAAVAPGVPHAAGLASQPIFLPHAAGSGAGLPPVYQPNYVFVPQGAWGQPNPAQWPVTSYNQPAPVEPVPAAPVDGAAYGEGPLGVGSDYTPYDAAMGGGYDGLGMGFGMGGPGVGGGMWFARGAGLLMTRDNPNNVALSFEDGAVSNVILNSRDVEMGWVGGYEVGIGRRLGPNSAFEVSFWSLAPSYDLAYGWVDGGTVSTTIDMSNATLAGLPLGAWWDLAPIHSIERSNEIYNTELNFLLLGGGFGGLGSGGAGGCCDPCCTPCRQICLTWFAGARWFRFDENLRYGSDPVAQWVYLDVDAVNDLIGFQIGTQVQAPLTQNLSLFATPRVGLFANSIQQKFRLYHQTGEMAVTDTGTTIDFDDRKTDVSVLAQLDVGMNWQFAPRWSAYGGYRLVAISGVALADNQIPHYIADVNGIRNIDSNGSLLLHGFQAGLVFQF